MKIIKLGYYCESFTNEQINSLFLSITDLFNKMIIKKAKMVCHYFPKSALLSIIKDKKFYYSDIDFLNDYSESKSLYLMLNKVVAETNIDSPAKHIFKEILRLSPMINDDIAFDKSENDEEDGFIYNRRNYVFCCSLDNDCLSNWKYYGKGDGYEAYNVSFETSHYLSAIKNAFKFKEYKCLSGMVIYDDKLKSRFISDLMQKIDSFLAETNISQEMMHALQTRLFYYLIDISLFFKDFSYKDEKEYRFVICIDNSKIKSNSMEYDFRFANNTLVPFIKIPFEKEMIELIAMGPSIQTDTSVKSLSALLEYYGYNNTAIGVSTIPLRY